jgi:hypothetical protein
VQFICSFTTNIAITNFQKNAIGVILLHCFVFIKTHHLNSNTTFSTQLKLSEINLIMCMHAYMSMLDVMNCVFILDFIACVDCVEELNYPCDCCDCSGCYQGK